MKALILALVLAIPTASNAMTKEEYCVALGEVSLAVAELRDKHIEPAVVYATVTQQYGMDPYLASEVIKGVYFTAGHVPTSEMLVFVTRNCIAQIKPNL